MEDLDNAASRALTEREATALRDVAAERRRQVEQEGWTPRHDDGHDDGSLAAAGACYALSAVATLARHVSVAFKYGAAARTLWPWGEEWRKPKDARRDLVRAAALIVAEIERLDRARRPHSLGTGNASTFTQEPNERRKGTASRSLWDRTERRNSPNVVAVPERESLSNAELADLAQRLARDAVDSAVEGDTNAAAGFLSQTDAAIRQLLRRTKT